jgi:hypothetical protein
LDKHPIDTPAPSADRAPAKKTLELDDGSRIVLADQGNIGVVLFYEERADVERSDRPKQVRRWKTVEELLIPREAIEDVCRELLGFLGKEAMIVSSPKLEAAACPCPRCATRL